MCLGNWIELAKNLTLIYDQYYELLKVRSNQIILFILCSVKLNQYFP
jgi:hypothetical protein